MIEKQIVVLRRVRLTLSEGSKELGSSVSREYVE